MTKKKEEKKQKDKHPKKDKKEKEQVTISKEELEALKEEVNEFKNKYIRAIAEAENARKRLLKEKHELTKHALKEAILNFLIPLDHFENALGFTEQASDEVKNWSKGFHMILAQFKDALNELGVTPIEALHDPFDPHLHEAVEMRETDEYKEGTIIEQLMKGYKMGDKIIRPAKVVVAKKVQQEKQEEKAEHAPEKEKVNTEENSNG